MAGLIHFPTGSRFGDEEDGDENGKQKNKEKTAQVRGFVSPGAFLEIPLIVCLSGFPRWEFAR